jgi:1-deoxy-D-xylulose-5-phosphate reductoisomerase
LNFRKPDYVRFPSLRLVNEACEAGGVACAVLAAADEWAVENFIKGKIKYTDIAATVADCLEKAPQIACDSLNAVLEANDWTWKYLSR